MLRKKKSRWSNEKVELPITPPLIPTPMPTPAHIPTAGVGVPGVAAGIPVRHPAPGRRSMPCKYSLLWVFFPETLQTGDVAQWLESLNLNPKTLGFDPLAGQGYTQYFFFLFCLNLFFIHFAFFTSRKHTS